MNLKFSIFFKFLVFSFWFCNFNGSANYVDSPHILSNSHITLSAFLNHSILGTLPSPNVIIGLALGLYIIINFSKYYSFRKNIYILFFTMLVIMLHIMNPNNVSNIFVIGAALLPIFVYIVLLIAFLYLNDDIKPIIIGYIFKIGFIFSIFYSAYYMIRYILGYGIVYLSVPRTIVQHDVLMWISIFQVLSLIIFFTCKKKLYIISSLFLFLVMVLSFVRSPLMISLIVSVFVILNYLYREKKIDKGFSILLIVIIGFVSILSYFSADINLFGLNISDYLERYSSVFSYFTGPQSSNPLYSDSGHIEEAIALSKLFFSNWDKMFWGFGIGQRGGMIREATGGFAPHNTYVYAWLYFGLFMTFYLLYFTAYFFRKFVKSIFLKDNEKFYNYCIAGFSFFIFIMLISGWTSSQVKFIMTDLLFTSQFVLLLTISNFTKDNFEKVKEYF